IKLKWTIGYQDTTNQIAKQVSEAKTYHDWSKIIEDKLIDNYDYIPTEYKSRRIYYYELISLTPTLVEIYNPEEVNEPNLFCKVELKERSPREKEKLPRKKSEPTYDNCIICNEFRRVNQVEKICKSCKITINRKETERRNQEFLESVKLRQETIQNCEHCLERHKECIKKIEKQIFDLDAIAVQELNCTQRNENCETISKKKGKTRNREKQILERKRKPKERRFEKCRLCKIPQFLDYAYTCKKCRVKKTQEECINCAGEGLTCTPAEKQDHTSLRKSCDNCHIRKKKCQKSLTDKQCHYCKKEEKDCTYNIKTKNRQYYHTIRKLKLMVVYWNILLEIKRAIQDYQSQIITEESLKEKLNKNLKDLPTGTLRQLVCNLFYMTLERESKQLTKVVEEIDRQTEPSKLIEALAEAQTAFEEIETFTTFLTEIVDEIDNIKARIELGQLVTTSNLNDKIISTKQQFETKLRREYNQNREQRRILESLLSYIFTVITWEEDPDKGPNFKDLKQELNKTSIAIKEITKKLNSSIIRRQTNQLLVLLPSNTQNKLEEI
ncbi:10355_t:CDS:2, partial [Cetraspora pellucida]